MRRPLPAHYTPATSVELFIILDTIDFPAPRGFERVAQRIWNALEVSAPAFEWRWKAIRGSGLGFEWHPGGPRGIRDGIRRHLAGHEGLQAGIRMASGRP